MSKYSVIVFDLGNVLIPFDYTPFLVKMNEIKEGLGDELWTRYKNNYTIHRDFEAGKINKIRFLEIMNDWCCGLVEGEFFCRAFSDIFTENKNVISLLPVLKKKYKLVLLSNTNGIHMKYGWEKYDFLKYFDKLCLSHEIGAVKPEKKMYEAVENFSRRPSGEHIFIDDVKEYADGAILAGWDAIQFTGYDNLLSEFKMRSIL
jgi:glucose-1-phosphatase